MTDHQDAPLDDELVSAVLDDEAGADERAAVLEDPAARARLEELRAVADQVGAPVEALPDATVDRMLEVALAAADDDGAGAAVDGSPTEVRSLDDRRRAGLADRYRGLGTVAAVAAAIVVIVGLGALVIRTSGSGSSEDAAPTAAQEDQSALAPSTTAVAGGDASSSGAADDSANESSASADTLVPGDWLGAYPDLPALLAAVRDEPGLAFRAAPEVGGPGVVDGSPAVCPAEVEAVTGPHEVVGVSGASVADQVVEVVVVALPDGSERVVVTGARDCAVLADELL